MDQFCVLIVDDDESIVKALQRLLHPNGYQIFTATAGEEALDILKHNHVDLIISDEKMPGMTGIELLRKSIEIDPDIIRILLTGYAELDVAVKAINEIGIHKFITKPWIPDDLKLTVQRALEQYGLIMENRDLSYELRKRDSLLSELEKRYPGITAKPPLRNGAYVIPDED